VVSAAASPLGFRFCVSVWEKEERKVTAEWEREKSVSVFVCVVCVRWDLTLQKITKLCVSILQYYNIILSYLLRVGLGTRELNFIIRTGPPLSTQNRYLHPSARESIKIRPDSVLGPNFWRFGLDFRFLSTRNGEDFIHSSTCHTKKLNASLFNFWNNDKKKRKKLKIKIELI
jgi:hypothetical protein